MRHFAVALILLCSLVATGQAESPDFLAGQLRDDCKLLNDEHRNSQTQVDAFKAGQCAGYLQGWLEGIGWASEGYPFLPENESITVGQISRVFILYVEKHPEKENSLAFTVVLDAMMDAKLISEKRLFGGPKWAPPCPPSK
jgi:hypothetical protein